VFPSFPEKIWSVKLQKNIAKKFLGKSYTLNARKIASNHVSSSQNRRLKFLPVNFRYHRKSDEKSKNVGHFFSPWSLGCKNLFVNMSFRSQMAAEKLPELPKKKVT
jgi:hypothetical protein